MTRRLGTCLGVLLLVVLTGCNDDDSDDRAKVSTSSAAKPAKLSIHPVVAIASGVNAEPSRQGGVVLEDPDRKQILELGPPELVANDISSARAEIPDNSVDWLIMLDFNHQGDQKFGELTATAACAEPPANQIAIVIDDEIVSAPVVQVECGKQLDDGTQISGGFTKDSAEELAERINRDR
ncbi:SecDF P1 head subdomain-containing protein [Nocardioides sp. Root151]|uniref:SecDF P1 head subdomain-containing protein n=1 Tax=Nocardioides sp. Root151 TaxID=1736475 RepID=UPI000702726A|nr:hypothetical protein [Nocardioides sp. Root151]KQZ67073.1 hypothetical protein ASD66_18955 [Nocardioides sp. Root151]